MTNFKEFIEQEAAPVMGNTGTQPSAPGDEGTHNDSRVLAKELDIDPNSQKRQMLVCLLHVML